jgi:hypothetical protein
MTRVGALDTMIARLQILLPYSFSVPVDQEFQPYGTEIEGYVARVYSPYRCQVDPSMLEPDSAVPMTDVGQLLGPADPQPRTTLILVEGAETTQANALQIDFIKDDFDRRRSVDSDPPVELAFRVANDLLARLRTLGRSGRVKPISPKSTVWRIEYLNDDESQLESVEGLHRAVGGASWRWKVFGLRGDLWTATRDLPDDFEPTPWDTLLLDALDLLPEVGPTIVLAFASIETRIASAIDVLAAGSVSGELWEWIRDREGDYRKEPSITEQVDVLLHAFSGHSLKEDTRLWEAFRNLRQARNTFVHEGRAEIGGQPVTPERASQLLATAGQIIEWIEQLLPESERRPRDAREGEQTLELSRFLTAPLPPPETTQDAAAGAPPSLSL